MSKLILALSLFLLSTSILTAVPKVSIDVQVDVAEIVKEVSDWVSGFMRKNDANERDKIRQSVSELAVLVIDVSTDKMQLSKKIKEYTSNSDNRNGKGEITKKEAIFIRKAIRRINTKISKIEKSVRNLDSKWAVKNLKETKLIYSTYKRKRAVFDAHMGHPAKVDKYVSDNDALKMINSFESEGEKLSELADTISTTLDAYD